ncbi:hypothetical protein C8R44DRAFT_782614 [Mycena epipterygia]|nr:hypothetical protein C8R44DRAFT_782614 [Mycena epipterygia]
MPNPTISTNHKRPFQDITERFVSPRPKRKPKTPGGALGEKLRLRVIETAKSTVNAFPSSLPPSSPPLYSSSSRGLPLLSSEDEVARGIQEEYGRPDFASALSADEDADEDAENRSPTASHSDPFGFFAVERKLKAERDVLALPPPAAVPRRGGAVRYTDDKGRDDGRVMPSTPHKPKLGKRRVSAKDDDAPADVFSSETPSPVKGAGDDILGSLADGNVDMEGSRELFPDPKARESDDDDAPPKRKKARQSSEASVPPRRSTRTQTKAVPKGKEVSKPKTRARKAPVKTKAAAGKKKKAPENNDSDDDDQQEKFEAERQARLEYFKRLDDYSFEKENVYVV